MNKIDRRVAWMARFEEHVVSQRPDFSGKIEWDSAYHFYNRGMNPLAAAMVYLFNRATVE